MESVYECEVDVEVSDDEVFVVKRECRVSKLGRVTGRLDSLETLGEYLTPATLNEAIINREQIEKSDRMKKLFGTRPSPSQTASSSSPSASSSSPSASSPSASSPSATSPSSHYPSVLLSSSSSSSLSSSSSSARAAKIKKMTGRRLSVDAIQGLLSAATPEEAVHNGRLIESSDKVMQVLGQRPPTRMIMTVLTSATPPRPLSRRGSANSIIIAHDTTLTSAQ